jgi:RsiW-degrading membrane proteinase PrsW (M82 family)
MSNSDSTEFSPRDLAVKWQTPDIFAIGLWIHIPSSVYLGRAIVFTGARNYSVEVSAWTQFLVGMFSFVMVSVTAVIVLLGTMALGGSKTRRVFIHVALIAGVCIELVYIISCWGTMVSILDKMG